MVLRVLEQSVLYLWCVEKIEQAIKAHFCLQFIKLEVGENGHLVEVVLEIAAVVALLREAPAYRDAHRNVGHGHDRLLVAAVKCVALLRIPYVSVVHTAVEVP